MDKVLFLIDMHILNWGVIQMAYKEIVTKAVIGKGKKKYKDTYQVAVEQTPSTILGCWIINHNFQGKEVNQARGAVA